MKQLGTLQYTDSVGLLDWLIEFQDFTSSNGFHFPAFGKAVEILERKGFQANANIGDAHAGSAGNEVKYLVGQALANLKSNQRIFVGFPQMVRAWKKKYGKK